MHDARRWLEVLGLGPDATKQQIDHAYRDLVKVWHPDRFESDPALRLKAQEKLRELNAAYDGLRRSGIPPRDPSPRPRAQAPPTATSERPATERPATAETRSFSPSAELRLFGGVLAATAAIVGLLLTFGMRREPIAPTDIALIPDRQPAAQPDTRQADTRQPDMTQPETRRPDTTPPDTTHLDTTQPGDVQRSEADPPPLTPAPAVEQSAAVSPAAEPATPAMGVLTVISQPNGATVFLNGKLVGRTPLTLGSIVPGAYRVRVELDDYPVWSSSVRLEAGGSEKLIAFFERR